MAVGRNDPCPCGSGLKYKKCCGKILTVIPEKANTPEKQRSCGECTACCDGWLRINVYGHEVYPGKPCPYSSGHHCTIYERRPENPCQKFSCGWIISSSPLPEQLRPDKCGWVMLPAKLKWRSFPVDVLAVAADAPAESALQWFQQFAMQSQRPLIYQDGDNWVAFGPEEFRAEMSRRMAAGEKLWE